MIQAIRPIHREEDTEHIRIMMELRKLGITPTGDKQVDKVLLKQAKEKKAEHIIENKIQNEKVNNEADKDRAMLEEIRTGAMALAELNRVLLGI